MRSVLLSRLRALFQRSRREREFADEVEAHLSMLTEDHIRQGMTPAEARLAAKRTFGGVTQIQEEHREARALLHIDRLIADIRYALRSMARNPGFTLLAVTTLGLGIGVNTTLFTAYNAIVLKPLAIADPDAVYRFERWFQSGARGNVQYAFTWTEYAALSDRARSYAGMAAASWGTKALVESGAATGAHARIQLTSANYFDVLGVVPQRGRGFLPEDDHPSSTPVAVLSPAFARRLSAGIGSTVKMNDRVFTVIGIAPDDFTGTAQDTTIPDAWVPAAILMRDATRPDYQILARLRAGTGSAAARAETSALLQQMGSTIRENDATVDVTLQHPSFLDNTEDPRFQAAVAGVMLLVGTVLLVACANIANLMLARSASRQKEIGVRLAVGASRPRLIRQLLTESVVLGIGGGVAGLLFARWSSTVLWGWAEHSLLSRFGTDLHFPVDPAPDLRVLGYALGLSLFAGVLFGLLPALRATRPDLIATLKDDAPGSGMSMSRSRLRALLIGGQVAVSVTLLITAGLLSRGLSRARTADPGFDARTLLLVFGDYGHDGVPRRERLLERIGQIPGVVRTSIGDAPLSGTWTPPMIAGEIHGRTLASVGDDDYHATLGLPILRGRGFTRREVISGAKVALISEGAARHFWPAGDPIGRRFQLDMDFRGTMVEYEVVGVVKDARLANLSRVDPAHVYVTSRPADFSAGLVRIQGDPQRAIAAIRLAVRETDPELLPSLTVQSIADGPLWLQQTQSQTMAAGASILAGLALLLAAAGIYGVMAYLVAQRTHEIGVRMALGAGAGRVVREVLIGGLRPVVGGLVAGILVAAAISTLLHSTLQFPGAGDFLYGVSAYDPLTFVGLSGLVLALAALASVIPARRAARVDPLTALHYE